MQIFIELHLGIIYLMKLSSIVRMVMTDKDILRTLCKYMKLVAPNEVIKFRDRDIYSCVIVPLEEAEFIMVNCVKGEIILITTDRAKIPSWLKDIFDLTSVSMSHVSNKLPITRLEYFYRYFMVEVKDKDLLNE